MRRDKVFNAMEKTDNAETKLFMRVKLKVPIHNVLSCH